MGQAERGSHIDLNAANKHKVTVAEVRPMSDPHTSHLAPFFCRASTLHRPLLSSCTLSLIHCIPADTDQVTGSNVVSVAEHVLMSILVLVRNFVPAHDQARSGQWNVAEIARNSFDLEGKVVGTVGCGRIGYRVLQRLAPFGCKELLWYDYTDLPAGQSLSRVTISTLNSRLRECAAAELTVW